jgi:cytoskeleton protein RodZ
MLKLPRLKLVEEQSPQPYPDSGSTLDDSDPPAETVGEELRRARERRGKDIRDVWRVLKIRQDYLAALEQGNFDALPDRGHTIGFVRCYATHLGLNAKEIAGRMKAEMDARGYVDEAEMDLAPQPERTSRHEVRPTGQHGEAKKPAIDFSPQAESELPRSSRMIAGVMLVGMIYSGYYLFISGGHTQQPPVSPVPARFATAVQLKLEPPAQESHADIEQPTPASTPQPAPSPPTVLAPTEPVAMPVESAPKVIAPQAPGKQYGSANKTSRITLRVHRATRVAVVEATRKRIFIDRILEAGDSYRVPNLDGLKLTAPDAGAVELILDGSSVGFAGKDGATANGLSLTPQTIAARHQRG